MFRPTIPAATRRAVNRRSGGCCENCGLMLPLELHHLHYETVGWERPDDLKALCRDCHRSEHVDMVGEFWRDPQDMECYWATYGNG